MKRLKDRVNAIQKRIMFVALIFVLGSVLFPPWSGDVFILNPPTILSDVRTEYSPLFLPPNRVAGNAIIRWTVDRKGLTIQLTVITVICLCGLFVFKNHEQPNL